MPSTNADPLLNARAQRVLRALVQRYIRDGQPVGSRSLTRDSGLEVSAATIRNVLSDLEEGGYVRSPHTSSGRIPTDRGYRFLVDSLLTAEGWRLEADEGLSVHFEAEGSSGSLVGSTSNLLSGLTRLAGVVTLPRRGMAAIRHLEFLPLSERRVLAILVLNDHEVQNRVIHTDREYTASELEHVSNYLNAQFVGRDIAQVRAALLEQMQADRRSMNELMSAAMEVAQRLFQEAGDGDEDYVIAGETNLMSFAELADVDKLKGLFDAFSRKRDILHLLDRCLSAEGVQIFIGEESGYEVFDGMSLVTSTYGAGDELLGVLGVIGPTRMDYGRVIPIVDVTARLLGHALNSRQ